VRKVCPCEVACGVIPVSLYAFSKSLYSFVVCVELKLLFCYRFLAATNKPSTIIDISIKTNCFSNCSTQRRTRWHYHLLLNKGSKLVLLQIICRSQMADFMGTMIQLTTYYKVKLSGRKLQSDVVFHFASLTIIWRKV
jgi:hypothetical protein